MDYYCIRILLNQLKSNTSSFHKLYSVVYVSGNNKKKSNFKLLDMDIATDIMDDSDNITDELKNEILNIEDEEIEDNSLYYKRKVEKIKNILLHIEPVNALLFNFYYFDGMSYADISRMSGVNWQSIRYNVVKTLEVVKKLTEHRLFSFTNPNRMRALIGSYASANPTGFNREDGAGYEFLADFTLHIDKANPQTAARILTAMRSWRSLEANRREKARAALARIASATGLSADVRDIAERTLA